MTVAELRALAPLADVYELRADARYLVLVGRSEDAQQIAKALSRMNVSSVIIRVHDPADTKIFDFGSPDAT